MVKGVYDVVCPDCGGNDIEMVNGDIIKWECQDCYVRWPYGFEGEVEQVENNDVHAKLDEWSRLANELKGD